MIDFSKNCDDETFIKYLGAVTFMDIGFFEQWHIISFNLSARIQSVPLKEMEEVREALRNSK